MNKRTYDVFKVVNDDVVLKCSECGNVLFLKKEQFANGDFGLCDCQKPKLEEITEDEIEHQNRIKWTKESWGSMKSRCYNKNATRYAQYGGRGIKVCDRWLASFENFLEDMGERKSQQFSLDRIDVNGDYCPENCKWSTAFEQANNKQTTITYTYKGFTGTIAVLARKYELNPSLLGQRLRNGWSIEKAIEYNASDYIIPKHEYTNEELSLRSKNIDDFDKFMVDVTSKSFLYSHAEDIRDRLFGAVVPICRAKNAMDSSGTSDVMYVCQCSCGNFFLTQSMALTGNKVTSCGCGIYKNEKKIKHGMTGTPEFSIWSRLKLACTNKNHPEYKKYGGAGVTFYKPWQEDFRKFYEEVGARPSENHTIYRIDETKGFEPGNCIWEERKGKARNKKNLIKVVYKGKECTLREISDDCGIPSRILSSRLRSGWDVDKAIQTAYIKQTELQKKKQEIDAVTIEDKSQMTYDDFKDEIVSIENLSSKAVNLIGKNFGKLEVVALLTPAIYNRQKKVRWLCKCDCGNYCAVIGNSLKTGNTTNCGCVRKSKISTHGLTGIPEYHLWNKIKKQCYLPSFATYHLYGAKGIKMDENWRKDFGLFLEDVGRRPTEEYVFARIDKTKNFTKDNCYWKRK